MHRASRSRSPRLAALSTEAREAILIEFGQLYWAPPDGPDIPPWTGLRAAKIVKFRDSLVTHAEAAARELDLDPDTGYSRLSRETILQWQRFTFFDDAARMSDVLFRGPIEPSHADDVDLRLHSAWRRFHATVFDFEEFVAVVSDFRVSAVRVAMMLETARPPEASQIDGMFELPDARTLASLLSLRCEKDDAVELLEMYRLVCQKLDGVTCAFCNQPFDEGSSVGLFDGCDSLVIPVTVPKVFVPQCGHAIHTLCFGSQLIADRPSCLRGGCQKCGLSYAWTSIDIDPMINAFCLLFGSYVDKRALEMQAMGEISRSTAIDIAEICQNFSQELCGLVSPSSAWVLLTRRHGFSEPEAVNIIGDVILRLLSAPECDGVQPVAQPELAVIGPDDHSDDAESAIDAQDGHLTEVFISDANIGTKGCVNDIVGDPLVPDDGIHSPLD